MKKKNIKKVLIGIIVAGVIGGLGVLLMIKASTGPEQTDLEDTTPRMMMSQFNSNFTPYEGVSQSATRVRQVINAIKTSNATDRDHYVEYTGPEESEIETLKKYTVQLKYNEEGYVCEVIVTENEEANNVVENNIVDNDIVE